MAGLRMSLKLGFLVAFLLLATLIVSWIGVSGTTKLNQTQQDMQNFSSWQLIRCGEIAEEMLGVVRFGKNAVLVSDAEKAKQFAEQTRDAVKQTDTKYAEMKENFARDPDPTQEQLDHIKAFGVAWEEFKKVNEELLTLAVQKSNIKARELSLNKAFPLVKTIDLGLKAIGVAADKTREIARAANDNEARVRMSAKISVSGELRYSIMELQQMHTRHIESSSDKDMDALDKEFTEDLAGFLTQLDKIDSLSLATDAADLTERKAVRTAFNEFKTVTAEIQKLSRANTDARSQEISLGSLRDVFLKAEAPIQKLQESLAAQNAKLSEASAATFQDVRSFSIGTAVAALVLGALLAFFLISSITRQLTDNASNLKEGASQIASASSNIASSSQHIASGASEQAASLEETSASLKELTSTSTRNADNSREAQALATKANSSTENGKTAMHRMSETILKIKKASDETAKIIKTIDEIAFQTNLLALNAAVEAARAGAAGAGFAVVADEVRNLALRSAEAAKTTASMIDESQRHANDGVSVATQVEKNLGEIADHVARVTSLISEVALASDEQSKGIGQITIAVTEMEKVTQSNSATSEEAAAASEQLASQSREIQMIVKQLEELVFGRGAPEQVAVSSPRHDSPPPPPPTYHPPTKPSAPFKPLKATKKPAPAKPPAPGKTVDAPAPQSKPLDGPHHPSQTPPPMPPFPEEPADVKHPDPHATPASNEPVKLGPKPVRSRKEAAKLIPMPGDEELKDF